MAEALEGASSSAPGRARPLRLLIVEDNADDALLLERVLRRAGLSLSTTRAETAADMEAALLAPEPPDIIVADYTLPRFSGPEALQLLRKSRLDIPFIMTSGAISEETAVASMRAGAQDYVTKGNLARIVPVIERELREASTRRGRHLAEAALRASQTRFHRLVEGMPIGLLLSDAHGHLRYANGAVERLLGRLEEGMPLANILPDWPALVAFGKEDQQSSDPRETTYVGQDGQTIHLLVGIARLNPESPQEEDQIAAFLVDVTLQRKSAEMLRRTEKLAVAGRFAASIAHEINNPLEAITNCLYLVSQSALEPEPRQYLDLAQKELNRVGQITMQTLRFYRRSTQATHIDVHDLLDNVLSLLDPRLRRAQVTVSREYSTLTPILAHDGEIRQVFANLIGNALDALQGGGLLRLRTRTSRDWRTGRPGIRISIADTGAGMSSPTRQRLFEPFFSTKGITGTGLGLWISREILDKHSGIVQVRSRETSGAVAGGTVFSILLPYLDATPGEAPAAREP